MVGGSWWDLQRPELGEPILGCVEVDGKRELVARDVARQEGFLDHDLHEQVREAEEGSALQVAMINNDVIAEPSVRYQHCSRIYQPNRCLACYISVSLPSRGSGHCNIPRSARQTYLALNIRINANFEQIPESIKQAVVAAISAKTEALLAVGLLFTGLPRCSTSSCHVELHHAATLKVFIFILY